MTSSLNAGSGESLRREIRRWDLIALLINITVGAGIFRLPAEAYAAIGAYSLVAFLVCAVIMGVIVLCVAEVASRFAATGGPYLYAREAFGPAFGFMIGWLMWLTRLTGLAALANLFAEYLGYFIPAATFGWARPAVITGIVVALTVINILGVRQSAVVSNALTISKLAPLLLFVAVGLFFIQPAQIALGPKPGLRSFAAGVFLLIWVFSGFEAVLVNAGEARQPRRDIPIALVTALGVATLLFVLVDLVCIGTLPGLGASVRPLADASAGFLGGAGPPIISAGALISIFGTMNVVMLAGSRLPFAMAERGEVPRFLSATHVRFHTPHISILVSAVLALSLALSGTFIYLLTLSVITRVLVYASSCAALPVLRRRGDSAPAAFHVPWAPLVSIVAVLFCAGLLLSSGWREARDVAIVSATGLGVYSACQWTRRSRRERGKERAVS